MKRYGHVLGAAALALAAPLATAAAAADLALVIDTSADDDGAAALLGDALNARGYEVYERLGADRAAIREALASLEPRLGDADRAIFVFAGEVRAEDGRRWLLPADYDGEGRIDAAFDAVPLDLLLALAAERPGRAAVVLAHDEAELPAAGEVPQGVLVIAGARAAALAAVAERLLAEDLPAAEALDGLDGVGIAGFLSPDAGFAAPGAPLLAAPPPAPGVPPEDASPAERAEAAEAALALDQAARRGVQSDLTVLGFGTRGIDGIFGPGTRAAIAEWQEREDFEATGFLTAEQLARLREAGAARSAELAAEAERAREAEEAADAAFWRTTGAGGSEADLRAYLARYPNGIYAGEARSRLGEIDAAARAEAEAADREAWDAAEGRGTQRAYRRYLEERPDGAFAEAAEARIAALRDAPRAEAARAEAEAREAGLGLNRASRAVIESQLAALGFDVGEPDGEFDDASRAAIGSFQSQRGLEPTGYVDQATVQALIVASLGLR